MSGLVAVPVRLDALLLPVDEVVVGAFADFARLPYNDGARDVNADVANLAESILAPPFQDAAYSLKAGIHLHWAMPDALTAGAHGASGTVFPQLPNRWLVVRSRVAAAAAAVVEARWVVESDYLYPDGAGDKTGAVGMPLRAAARGARPFRRQGRRLPWPSGSGSDPQAEYAPTLTAAGYGDPAFAAFYPACSSVFGVHDDDYGDTADGLQYDVFGWYADRSGDPVASLLAGLGALGQPAREPAAVAAALADRYGWSVAVAEQSVLADPELALLAYARLRLPADLRDMERAVPAPPPAPAVAVGATGVEALAAYLAQTCAPTTGADPGAQARLEDQLQALQLGSRLADRRLDLGAAFRQARHEQGFVAAPAGTLWTISPERAVAGARPDAPAAAQLDQVTLPPALAASLDALNRAQDAYDRAVRQIEERRRQLFADWSKYLICAYPPPAGTDDYPDTDEVRAFIQRRDLGPLTGLIDGTGRLDITLDDAGRATGARDAGAGAATLAGQVAAELRDVLGQLAVLNRDPAVAAAGVVYGARPTLAPRFWQPREPVVLLVGPAATPSERHGQDGQLTCHAMAGLDAAGPAADGGARLLTWLDTVPEDDPGVARWTEQPWNPLFVEWSVEVFPTVRGSNLNPGTCGYSPDVLTGGFTLPVNEPDLLATSAGAPVQPAATEYSGRATLTPAAARLLTSRLTAYLTDPATTADPALNAVLSTLTAPGFSCLSQALGGFGAALLMRHQTFQLPVDDPLGFPLDQAFTATVAAALGGGSGAASMSAQPLTDFLPLRSGALRLLRLRLLDSFGRSCDADLTRVVVPHQTGLLGDTHLIGLPPRFAQPARLNLRWLAAEPNALGADEMEMNDHPATSPVCGWIVPNNLDGSLAVYDAAGRQLGILDEAGRWDVLPGATATAIADIGNVALRSLVTYLIGQGPAFLADFLSTLDAALDAIDPQSAAQHLDLALLMGRPIALTRVALELELDGGLAVSQSWSALRGDLRRTGRDEAGIAAVQVPVRLGEFSQFGDGLVGYWQETPGAPGPSGDFLAPQSNAGGRPGIRTAADQAAPLVCTPQGPAITLSLLVDPRGSVHATSGVQPVKELRIPPDQYAPALAGLSVSFLTAPILAPGGVVDVPLPREPGYRWSWLSASDPPRPVSYDPSVTLASGPTQLRDGWLRLDPDPTPTAPSLGAP